MTGVYLCERAGVVNLARCDNNVLVELLHILCRVWVGWKHNMHTVCLEMTNHKHKGWGGFNSQDGKRISSSGANEAIQNIRSNMRGGCSPHLVNDSSVERAIRLHNTVQHNTLSVWNDLMWYVGASHMLSPTMQLLSEWEEFPGAADISLGVCALGYL